MITITKVIEISSESENSFEDAIEQGIVKDSGSVDDIRGAWVKEPKASVDNERTTRYRVELKVSVLLLRALPMDRRACALLRTQWALCSCSRYRFRYPPSNGVPIIRPHSMRQWTSIEFAAFPRGGTPISTPGRVPCCSRTCAGA